MTNSIWLIVASMLATVAGVVVQKLVDSITGQRAKDVLDKERKNIEDEYTKIRRDLKDETKALNNEVKLLQVENIALQKECNKLEYRFKFCERQFELLRHYCPQLLEGLPPMDTEDE